MDKDMLIRSVRLGISTPGWGTHKNSQIIKPIQTENIVLHL
jgi:hypothetical protein